MEVGSHCEERKRRSNLHGVRNSMEIASSATPPRNDDDNIEHIREKDMWTPSYDGVTAVRVDASATQKETPAQEPGPTQQES
mgnify:CR=1 FL=1